MSHKVEIHRLATGVPGLDQILGGGLPEYSFNLVVGCPGSGKTTLALQMMFALATPERPALFFTIMGEPPLKMLRYQQQFAFFDIDKIGTSIRFVNLSDDIEAGDLGLVLELIFDEITASSPALVFVDSFRSVMLDDPKQGKLSLQHFIQQLGARLTSWQATSFLLGEYGESNRQHPIFTLADGVLSLEQAIYRNSMVRQIQILKMRGQATIPGMHAFRIANPGIEIFPAALVQDDATGDRDSSPDAISRKRLTMGVPRLDEMLGGGLPAGYSLLLAGPSGSGKTIIATAFLAEGVRLGEPGVIVAFEQTPSKSWIRTLDDLVASEKIGLINTRSLDLSIDEIVQRLVALIDEMKATRVVIDSLSGFELAIAPAFRADFRESLFRMVAVLSGLGVTVLLTSELEDRYTDLRFSPYGSAFLTDAIIVQRYIEVESRLRRVMAVVKVRASPHSNEIRLFEITDDGVVIGDPLEAHEGLLGGRPTRIANQGAETS